MIRNRISEDRSHDSQQDCERDTTMVLLAAPSPLTSGDGSDMSSSQAHKTELKHVLDVGQPGEFTGDL